VWPLIYFAPEIISFQQIAESGESPANLIQRVNLWRNLNGVRVGAFLLLSLAMVPVCLRAFSRS
jgi:hypothetical protein